MAPYERCELGLLNGGHSLLAYAGSLRGNTTVAGAVEDQVCLGWLHEWWQEASRHLGLPDDEIRSYLDALLRRWSNPRMRHLLSQIAADGSAELPVRILPTLKAERERARLPHGAARILAAWVCHLRGPGAPVIDTRSEQAREAARGPAPEAVARVLALLDTSLAHETALVDTVLHHVEELAETDRTNRTGDRA
ncbi:mannitol dehydrogenase family protein [Nocardiopsis xinjiangensis]|uniref:mannitol dehydrogenase family protein n=1 Tax=Nocardiopsis xinjiangensis TaxID=124285 RepID=UPI00034DC46B